MNAIISFALIAMFLLVGEHGLTQTIDRTSSKKYDWRSAGSPSSVAYRVGSGLGIIVRPSGPDQTTEGALREHLERKIDDAVDRDLTPGERKEASTAIERYLWKQLVPTELNRGTEHSGDTAITVRSVLRGEALQKGSTQLVQKVFDSDVFKGGSTEKKWALLSDAVGKAALSPNIVGPDSQDGISIGYTASIADVIRHATPQQLGQLFDLDAWPRPDWRGRVTIKQVAPGTPIPEDGFGSSPCEGQWCGSPSPRPIPVQEDNGEESRETGRAIITYSENAYEHVVVLQPGRTGFDRGQKRCTATLISPDWALSALHCFGDSGRKVRNSFNFTPATRKRWLELTPTKETIFAISLRREGSVSAFLVEKVYVPYVNELDIQYRSGTAPPKDIALIKIDGEEATRLPTYPKFAMAESIVANAAVTFVGYGWTDVSNYDWPRAKQAAFNWLTDSDEAAIQWRTGNWGGNGGPCLGDSGGPIFLDFIRGHRNDDERVVGVVSRLLASRIEEGAHCLNKIGEGEPLSSYVRGICAIADDVPTGCR